MIVNYNSPSANEQMGFGARANGSYREFFDWAQSQVSHGSILVATTVGEPDGNGGTWILPVIILGPAYYDRSMLNGEARQLLKDAGGLENFQAITLLHELLHIKTQLSHRSLADEAGITYSPDTDQAASRAIDNFFAKGCK